MAAREDFKDFYEKELQDQLKPLELKRKKIKRLSITGSLFLAVAIILFITASSNKSGAMAAGAFISLIPAIVLLIIYYNKKKYYTAEFKTAIVSEIIHFIKT